ncbi:hypothetical protein [Capnocytophaga felis]|nr:hypothetical protein [Capnocytophaga felis]
MKQKGFDFAQPDRESEKLLFCHPERSRRVYVSFKELSNKGIFNRMKISP